MPTGYTNKVQNGEITTLKEFALTCARGMSACITMRDEPRDAPIPEAFEPDVKYHDDKISEAKAVINEVSVLSIEACNQRANEEYEKLVLRYQEQLREQGLYKRRYQAMIGKVKEWKTNCEGIRTFMLEQLNSGLEADCCDYLETHPPVYKTGEQWRQHMLNEAASTISFNTQQRERKIASANDCNRWLKDLRESL